MRGRMDPGAPENIAITKEAADEETPQGYHSVAPETEGMSEVQDITSRYVNQMLYGCGNVECTQMLCHDGRQNAHGRPIRKYTSRSARTVALTLASGPRPRSRLCTATSQSGKRARFAVGDGPRDPSSITQLLADTKCVKVLCASSGPVGGRGRDRSENNAQLTSHLCTLRGLHTTLDQVERLCPSRPSLEVLKVIPSVVADIGGCIRYLLDTLPPVIGSAEVDVHECGVIDIGVRNGRSYPQWWKESTGESSKARMKYMDCLEDLPSLRLLQRCVLLIDRFGCSLGAECSTDGVPHKKVALWLFERCSRREIIALTTWLKKIFLRHWDGGALLKQQRTSLTCLQMLLAFSWNTTYPNWVNTIAERDQICTLPAVAEIVDTEEMVKTWLESNCRLNEPHLLVFSALFTTEQLAIYFRTLNHLRMQQAHSNSEKASSLRTRATRRSVDSEADIRLKFLEDHYLLLNIRRGSITGDSFNQLWQRRQSELLRPLRVRLGEMDALEVGHDLGGVQIEYFNLLCKYIFHDATGMFTSDPKTGLSYFRPGSLQPLYLFELFGLLFALAIFNGITLPVSLPKVFYEVLLGDSTPSELSLLRDGWPRLYKSFSDLEQCDVDVLGLECVFPLEANGIRLSVSSFVTEPDKDASKITARAVDVFTVGCRLQTLNRRTHESQPQDSGTPTPTCIYPRKLDWPGWCFEPAPAHELEELTRANTSAYVRNYVRWLVHASVAPQWHHFLQGFYRIIPRAHLKMLASHQLQQITEGTRHISIPDLRAATTYEGFSPQSTYMDSFWQVIESWPKTRQKQLLKFVTAAERVPVGGAGNVTFKIQRVSHPGAEESLPMSSTCFGVLMLPKYGSRELLERKLTVALEMGGEGFGTG